MTDHLLQIGVSNLIISIGLAIAAYAVHRTGKLPLVAHLLWVLVLVKLRTPPIFTVPLIPIPGLTDSAMEPCAGVSELEATSAGMLVPDPDGSSAVFDPGAEAMGSNASISSSIIAKE